MKIPLIAFGLFVPIFIQAQTQPLNAGFENWEEVGTSQEEPKHWNGLMSGDLFMLCSFGASQRVFRDSEEKVEGEFCVRIESKAIVGGLIVNGTVTTGRVIAPGAIPSAGYNMSIPNSEKFSHPFSAIPDSLVFWAKYSVIDDSDSALVSFFVHGMEKLKDPDHEGERASVVRKVQKPFQTGKQWQRFSFPMKTVNEIARPEYLLATFSSSYKAGKGSGQAKLWVDAVEFIYNPEELTSLGR